jgi:hypothetical protein
MEKSLTSIEKSLNAASTAGKSGSALGSLAVSLNSLVSALSSKDFSPKRAETVLEFTKGLITIVNTVDPRKSANFAKFTDSFSRTMETMLEIISPIKLLKLSLGAKILFEGKKPLFRRIVEGMSNSFDGLDTSKAEQGSKAVKALGEGLLSLSRAMKSLILIGIAAPLVFMGALVARGVVALFTSLGKKADDIAAGGRAMRLLGKGLLFFAAGLAAMALVAAVASPMLILKAIAIIAIFGLTFNTLGKVAPSIIRGARALAFMALGLIGFTMGLATYMLAMLIIPPILILQGIATITAFALVFAILGIDKVSKQIAQGALLLIGMAYSLFLFSGGLLIFGLALKLFTYESLLLGALLIAEIGLAMAILGRFSKQITAGATVMAEMGVGLALFSVGVLIFGVAVKLFDLESILIGAGLILAIGISTYIIGNLGSNTISDGAFSLAEMGAGLVFFSAGLLIFGLAVKLFDFESVLLGAAIIVGLGVSFAIVGALKTVSQGAMAVAEMGVALIFLSVGLILYGLALKGIIAMFQKDPLVGIAVAAGVIVGLGLAFAIIGPVAGFIGAGAGAMITVGIALILISAGIIIFGLAIKALKALFGDDLTNAGMTAGAIILGLGGAFALLGLMSPAIILGAVSGILMGATLLIFSIGLMVFGLALKTLNSSGLIVKDGDDYTLKGMSILSDLAIEFSKVGLIAGLNPFFYFGIATSLAIGTALASVGAGLMQAAESLEKVQNMDVLIKNLFGETGLIPKIAESFAGIGKKYGGFSALFGVDDVSMGIQVTSQFGEILQELAGGIVAFADFAQFPVKVPDPKDPSKLIYTTVDILGDIIPSLNENLPTLLSALSTSFAEIGEKYGGGGGWFGGDSPVQKGIDAVKGLGTVLSELAGGMVAFANFEEFPVQVPDAKDPSKLTYKAVNLFDIIPKIKTALIGEGNLQGKLTSKSGILFSLAEIFGQIGEKYGGEGFFSDNKVKEGVEAVQGIGGVVSELAQGIIAFANMERGLPNYDEKGKFNGTYTKFDLKTVGANITKVLLSLPGVFASIKVEDMEAAKEKADAAVPLANAISKIGKALGELMVEKEEGEKVNLVEIIGPSLKKFADDTASINIDSQKVEQLDDLADVLIKLSRSGDGLKVFADSLAATGDSFKKFSSGFGTFSSQLEKFIRFEGSFSNLVKNQYTFKFDKFAESMGVLKNNVNAFEVEKLKLTDSLMKSLAVLSNRPEDVGEDIKAGILKAFEELQKILKKLFEENANTVTAAVTSATASTTPAATAAGTTTAGKPATDAAKPATAKSTPSLDSDVAGQVKALVQTLNGIIDAKQGMKTY